MRAGEKEEDKSRLEKSKHRFESVPYQCCRINMLQSSAEMSLT